MPVYEFNCKECQHDFEELVLGSEMVSCPNCQSQKLEKLVSAFAVGDARSFGAESMPMPTPMTGGCGQCGDPGGPGACQMN